MTSNYDFDWLYSDSLNVLKLGTHQNAKIKNYYRRTYNTDIINDIIIR